MVGFRRTTSHSFIQSFIHACVRAFIFFSAPFPTSSPCLMGTHSDVIDVRMSRLARALSATCCFMGVQPYVHASVPYPHGLQPSTHTPCILKALFSCHVCVRPICSDSGRVFQTVFRPLVASSTSLQRRTSTATNRTAASVLTGGPRGHGGEFLCDNCPRWHCWAMEYVNIGFAQELLCRMAVLMYIPSRILTFPPAGHRMALPSFLMFVMTQVLM